MFIKIALGALAITLVVSAVITLVLMKSARRKIASMKEDPEKLQHEEDWEVWDEDAWKNDTKDEWNDWEKWEEKKAENDRDKLLGRNE